MRRRASAPAGAWGARHGVRRFPCRRPTPVTLLRGGRSRASAPSWSSPSGSPLWRSPTGLARHPATHGLPGGARSNPPATGPAGRSKDGRPAGELAARPHPRRLRPRRGRRDRTQREGWGDGEGNGAVRRGAAAGGGARGGAGRRGAGPGGGAHGAAELAPTGALRLGVVPPPSTTRPLTRRPASWGESASRWGAELARLLGVPSPPSGIPAPRRRSTASAPGRWTRWSCAHHSRGAALDSTPPPRARRDLRRARRVADPGPADADRPGVRIAAPASASTSRSSGSCAARTRRAGWGGGVRGAGGRDGARLRVRPPGFGAGGAERPGLRVVGGGSWSAARRGRAEGTPAALAFVAEAVEQAEASGLVPQVIARAGLVGVQAAPPARGSRLPATGAPAGPPRPTSRPRRPSCSWACSGRGARWPGASTTNGGSPAGPCGGRRRDTRRGGQVRRRRR